jgi:hypothetical protein
LLLFPDCIGQEKGRKPCIYWIFRPVSDCFGWVFGPGRNRTCCCNPHEYWISETSIHDIPSKIPSIDACCPFSRPLKTTPYFTGVFRHAEDVIGIYCMPEMSLASSGIAAEGIRVHRVHCDFQGLPFQSSFVSPSNAFLICSDSYPTYPQTLSAR